MKHSWGQWRAFLEAVMALAFTRVAVAWLPLRVSTRLVGLRDQGAGGQGLAAPEIAGRVGWAVRAAAARLPWHSTCLVQAMAAALLLRRRSVPATLSLGVARDQEAQLSAHAWLSCGDLVLTGEHAGEFQELQRFVLA